MVKGRIVAISGAAGGLGPSVVRAFSEAGAILAVAGRDEGKLGRMLDEAGVPAERRLATSVDLSELSEARRWAEAIRGAFGRVDVVLHLVGGYKSGTSIEEITTEDWSSLQQMLVITTLNVVRAFAIPLRTGGWGRFVGVTSPKAQAPTAKSALYAMGKAASDALVLALADELRGTGATANLVVVDAIDTPEARQAPGTGVVDKKAYGKTTPAEEIAAAMLFLCSAEAATINGVRLPLTGRG
jgi:NAD(P)-dependent dehydrogenase (short-subunit alcohol dehydrogenase family)